MHFIYASLKRHSFKTMFSVLLLANAQYAAAFTVEFVDGATALTNISQATDLLNNPGNRPRTVQNLPVINLNGGGAGTGNYGNDSAFPYTDTFAVRGTGSFTLTQSGIYTFGTNSDDGVVLSVNGNTVVNDGSLHAARNAFGAVSLTAGTHSFEVIFFENEGAENLEVFISAGNLSTFGGSFKLLSANPDVTGGNNSPNTVGQWSGVMDWPLVAVSMANLPDGRILTYSGSERRTWPTTERTFSATWDPATGQFTERLRTGHNMFCGAMSMLEDGKVFVNGGRNQSNSPWTSQYDYQNDSWSPLSNMASGGRWYPTTLALGNGNVFTAMGVSTNVRNPDLWSSDSGWRILNGIDFISLRSRRNQNGRENVFPLLSQAPNGSIYHFWDTVENHFISTAGNGSATVANDSTDNANHAGGIQVMYDEGKLLLSGNNDGSWGGNSSAVTSNAFTVDLNGANPVIRAAQNMNHPRKFHQMISLPTGEVLVVGGNTTGVKFQDSGSVFDTEIWNPQTGSWRLAAPLSVPRDYHSTALLMHDARVITAGGGYHPSDPNSGGTHQDAQIYSPSYLFNSDGTLASRPTLEADFEEVGYGQSFSVSTSGNIAYFSLIKMSATTHAINTDARFFKPGFTSNGNARYTLTMHSNPNVATPGYWMLFAVDNNGVPSVADVIKVSHEPDDPNNGQPPVITEIVSDPVSTDQNNSFQVSATGVGLTFSWNFGDGTGDSPFSAQSTISHSYSAPGKYIVSVTAKTPAGLTSVETFTQIVFGNLTTEKPVTSGALVEISARNEVWNVNPDNNSVGVINTNTLGRTAVINVGNNPRALAVAPNGRVWVVNKDDATISVVDAASRSIEQVISLDAGSRPHGIVFNNHSAYIALEGLGTVVQLNVSNRTERRRAIAGEFPRHLSLDSTGSRLYVSNFITPRLPGEQGANPLVQGQGAQVRVFTTGTSSLNPVHTILLGHIDRAISESQGPGLPNYLGPFTISPDGLSAWVPSKQDNILGGARRGGGGMTFDQTVRAVTSMVSLPGENEVLFNRVDHDNASVAGHAAFDPYGLTLFVSLEGNRQIALIDTNTNIEYARFDTGRAPQSVLLSLDGTRLYVHNFMDRSVGVYDVSDIVNHGGIQSTLLAEINMSAGEQLAQSILQGKKLFYDARDDRLAALDYMSCASCHNEGGHDGRIWDFTSLGEGLRNTIALNGTGGTNHGLMHWSGNFDEVQDFEGQIRSFSGGTGLMTDAQFSLGSRSEPLGDPKAGISSDLDALAAYLESLDTVAPSPYRNANGSLTGAAQTGKTLFAQFDCASCHSSTAFTDSSSTLVLHDVGTLDQDSGNRLGGPLAGIDTPTLLGVWQTAPYLHDGSAITIMDALDSHSAIQLSASQKANLAEYVLQIDNRETVDPVDQSLAPGQSNTGNLAQGEWTFYTLVNAGDFSSVNVSLTGMSADLDLYTQLSSDPTLDNYNCRSWNGGNDDEMCNSPASINLVIGVYGYRAGSYSISVEGVGEGTTGGTTTDGTTTGGTTGGGTTDITPGDSISGNLAQNEWAYFTLSGTEGFTSLVASLSGLTDDLDLYVGNGSFPTTESYICRSWNSGTSAESCVLNSSDTLIIGVFGYRSGSFTLAITDDSGGGTTDGGTTDGGTTDGGTTDGGTTDGGTTDGGTTDGGSDETIEPGQTVSNTVARGDWIYYQIENTADVLNAIATLTNLSADIDLYVRIGAQPTEATYDCRSWVGGTANESCGVNLSIGTNWIGVHGYKAGSFTLTLSSGTTVTDIAASGTDNRAVTATTWNYYRVLDSENLASVVADLTGMTNDADLYLKAGALPSLTDFDCRSFVAGSGDESCSINTQGQVAYIGVYGYQASPYTLSVVSSAAAQRKAQAKPPGKDEITRDLASKSLLSYNVSVGGGGSASILLLLLILSSVLYRHKLVVTRRFSHRFSHRFPVHIENRRHQQ